MRIYATFVSFRDAPSIIELVHAWDEYTRDGNQDGYESSRTDALAEYQGDTAAATTVTINVSDTAIEKALYPYIEGQVQQ